MSNCVELTTCVACDSRQLTNFLDFGKQPLANNYHNGRGGGEAYPLALQLCKECWHTQLTYSVKPAIMFDNYVYVTGTSKTLRDYCDEFAKTVHYEHGQGSVLDIACNDGTQLDSFRKYGWDTYGVDPAKNLYADAVAKGHDIVNAYWPTTLCKWFDVIVAQNVCAHTPHPLQFLKGIAAHLERDGSAYIQTSQSQMYQRNEFDTTYHEHISFFSINSMKCLAHRAGLKLVDVSITPIHGDSYVFELKHPHHVANTHLNEQIKVEKAQGRHNVEFYRTFGKNAKQILDQLEQTVNNYKQQGVTVVGYGAAAKGMTVLNARNIQLDWIVDDNPLKVGKLTPGTNIPIRNRSSLAVDEHIVCIPLAWNFFEEIKNNIETVRGSHNTTYVRYFPNLEIIKGE